MANKDFYNEKELSDLLGVKLPTIRRWRLEGRGPVFSKMEGLVRYSREDINAFVEKSKVRTTKNVGQIHARQSTN